MPSEIIVGVKHADVMPFETWNAAHPKNRVTEKPERRPH
jgi:hypothetical protein